MPEYIIDRKPVCFAENRDLLDFSIQNAGFFFEVEVCGFSVFGYNFYSLN